MLRRTGGGGECWAAAAHLLAVRRAMTIVVTGEDPARNMETQCRSALKVGKRWGSREEAESNSGNRRELGLGCVFMGLQGDRKVRMTEVVLYCLGIPTAPFIRETQMKSHTQKSIYKYQVKKRNLTISYLKATSYS